MTTSNALPLISNGRGNTNPNLYPPLVDVGAESTKLETLEWLSTADIMTNTEEVAVDALRQGDQQRLISTERTAEVDTQSKWKFIAFTAAATMITVVAMIAGYRYTQKEATYKVETPTTNVVAAAQQPATAITDAVVSTAELLKAGQTPTAAQEEPKNDVPATVEAPAPEQPTTFTYSLQEQEYPVALMWACGERNDEKAISTIKGLNPDIKNWDPLSFKVGQKFTVPCELTHRMVWMARQEIARRAKKAKGAN